MNVPLGIAKTGWPKYILVGLVFFVIYFVIFKFVISKFNLKTIGRESLGADTKLYSKKEYLEKKELADNKNLNQAIENEDVDFGQIIVDALGGADNITSVENCYTRLRTVLVNPDLVDKETLMELTKANGVMIKDKNVHVVYGMQVNAMRKAFDNFLARTK